MLWFLREHNFIVSVDPIQMESRSIQLLVVELLIFIFLPCALCGMECCVVCCVVWSVVWCGVLCGVECCVVWSVVCTQSFQDIIQYNMKPSIAPKSPENGD